MHGTKLILSALLACGLTLSPVATTSLTAQSCAPYCAASASSPCCSNTGTVKEYIDSVSIAGMTQATSLFACPSNYNGYINYTNRVVNLTVGGTYQLTLGADVPNVAFCSAFTPFCRAWFDWNGNGVFESSEQYDVPRLSGTLIYRVNVTVPATAVDYTRMRVGSAWPGPPPPCGVILNTASFQDFTVQVAGGAPAGRVVYGTGHPGTNGIPAIRANDVPTLGNATFELQTSGALPNTLAVLGISGDQGSAPLLGGTLLLDTTQVVTVLGANVDSLGEGAASLPIPSQPALLCMAFYCQWIVLDPGASQQFAFSPGLRLDIRQ